MQLTQQALSALAQGPRHIDCCFSLETKNIMHHRKQLPCSDLAARNLVARRFRSLQTPWFSICAEDHYLCSALLEDYMLPVESDFWQRSRVQELTRRIAAPLICLPAMTYVQNIWGRQNQHRKQKQRLNRKSKLTPQSALNTEAIPSPWNLSATHLWELQDAFRNWTVQTANPMMAHHTSQIISIFQSRGFLWLPLTEDAPHYSTSSLLINQQYKKHTLVQECPGNKTPLPQKSTNRGRKLNKKPLHQALLPRYPIDLSPVVAWQVH